MSESTKRGLLKLPLKVILTEVGASHFIQNKKKLLRIRLADSTEEYGISLDSFSGQTIQHMVLVDYVSKLEISMPEFSSSRQDVMDLTKLVVFSLLYKQFDKDAYAAIIDSDCIRKHNRTNPSQIIDERVKVADRQVLFHLSSREDVVEKARKAILDPLWLSIRDNPELTAEERNVFMLMTEKFLVLMSRLNWYIITRFYGQPGFEEISGRIHSLLETYMEKSKVAEYISLMVMELAMNCENSNMRQQAKRMYKGHPDVDTLLYDPEVRERVIAEMVRKHELVFLSWRLGGGSSSIGKQGRLQITLYDKDDEFQVVKESIETKKTADLSKRSLIDFYKELPEGSEGVDLGLYYLSYLDEACRKVNVKFDSLVNQYSVSNLMVITLVFNF